MKTKNNFVFWCGKHSLSKVFASIVADFHDFRKLFDQGKNNGGRIHRKAGRLLSKDPVGNSMLTRKDSSGHRMPTLSGRLAFLQNYQTK